MASELQKRMAVVILLIVIVLSAYGTWTLLQQPYRLPVVYEQGMVTGKVSVGIVPADTTTAKGGDQNG